MLKENTAALRLLLAQAENLPEAGEFDIASIDNGDGTQTLQIVKVGEPNPNVAQYSTDGRLFIKDIYVPDTITSLVQSCYTANGIESINTNKVNSFAHYCCGQNTNSLKRLIAPLFTDATNYLSSNSAGLEYIEIGSIGHPVTNLVKLNWLGTVSGRSSGGFDIVIYVDANDISGISADVTGNYAGGSKNYCNSVTYKSSVTGETLT